jgi:uncharacterized protein YdeI (YjbR/CyaY-like superfamily)
MKLGKTLYVTARKGWRKWLAKNHSKEKEIWLVYYKKSSGKPRISYNAAVEEALCYGWIDSTIKKVDEESFAQRFTPRRPNSQLSELNKERIRRLIKQKKITLIGLKAISHVFNSTEENEFIVPEEILERIKENALAWKNFQELPLWYKKIRISYIGSKVEGKKEFEKRLNYFIKMTAKNKRIGFMKD